jgi:hypothetical protein
MEKTKALTRQKMNEQPTIPTLIQDTIRQQALYKQQEG